MKLKHRLAKLKADRLKKKPNVSVFTNENNGFQCRNITCRARLVGKGSVYVTKVDDPQHGHQEMNFCRACAEKVNDSRRIDFRINLAAALGATGHRTRDYGPLVK